MASSVEEQQERIHAELLVKLSNEITENKFDAFKSLFQGLHGLPARDIEQAKTPAQLFTALKRNDKIRIGEYDALKTACKNASLGEFLKLISEYEEKIKEIGKISRPITRRDSGHIYSLGQRRTMIHNKLLEDLARDTTIKSGLNEMESMALTATTWLKENGCAIQADELTSPKRLFEEMYNWSVIGIGNYEKLKDLFIEIHRKDKLRMIEKAEQELAELDIPEGKLPAPQQLNPEEDKPQPNVLGAQPEPIRDPELEYQIPLSSEGKAGLMLIFNQFTEERQGTKNDARCLRNLFLNNFNFTVKVFENTPKEGVFRRIQSYKDTIEDESYHQLYIVMLSHGTKEGIFTSRPPGNDFESCKDEIITLEEILSMFTCDKAKQLAKKPKVFIIQACRGDCTQPAVKVDLPGQPEHEVAIDSVFSKQYQPKDADFLIAQSQTENYVSFRNPHEGAWFIQALCDVFEKHHKRHSVVEMLTMVNNEVSKRFAVATGSYSCQMPCFTSTLRKKLFLK